MLAKHEKSDKTTAILFTESHKRAVAYKDDKLISSKLQNYKKNCKFTL